jgi:hypothetical protein
MGARGARYLFGLSSVALGWMSTCSTRKALQAEKRNSYSGCGDAESSGRMKLTWLHGTCGVRRGMVGNGMRWGRVWVRYDE